MKRTFRKIRSSLKSSNDALLKFLGIKKKTSNISSYS